MEAAKAEVMKRQMDLLNERYDLSDHPAQGVTMSRGKPIQEGVRVKLPQGVTSDKLAAMTPEEIREKDLFPAGFFPLPHPNQPEGGMIFPKFHIDEIKKQEGRDLTRFDLDFDFAGPILARVPCADFSDHQARLGRRFRGEAGDHRQLLRAFQRGVKPQTA
jgi:cytochrome c peroxidase